MTGDRWRLPDGRDAIECRRSGRQVVAMPIVPGWPWPTPPVVADIAQCQLLPARYLAGAIPRQEPEA